MHTRTAKPVFALLDAGRITQDECDAAGMFYRLGRVWRLSFVNATAVASIRWRLPDGAWTMLTDHRYRMGWRFKETLAALPELGATAVSTVLVAEPHEGQRVDNDNLVEGLFGLSAHFFGEGKMAKKVSLPKVKFMDTTPERLSHANDNHRIGDDGIRRIEDTPFERMYHRRQLDADPEINETLYAAGKRYYSDWYHSGLCGIQAMDPGAVGGGGSVDPAYMMPVSEFAAEKRALWRAARRAVGRRHISVLEAIVIDGQTGANAGLSETRYLDAGKAGAVALDRLTSALYELARHYGLFERQRRSA